MNRWPSPLAAFDFNGPPIDRVAYIQWGLGLAAFKYAVEATVLGVTTGKLYTPLDFVNPLLAGRAEFLDGAPDWLGVAWVVWSLPFVVIALAWTARRAWDAGLTPWHALWVVVPVGNLIVLPCLAFFPSVPGVSSKPTIPEDASKKPHPAADLRSGVLALGVGVVYTLVLTAASVYLLGDYGVALFFGGPAVVGTAAGYLLNSDTPRTLNATFWHATFVVLIAMGAMLLLAMEGVICLVMALPLMLPLVLIGSVLGRSIALRSRDVPEQQQRGLAGALVFLPLLGLLETRLPEPSERMVETSVLVDATPQAVWDTVIAFPPIDSPEPWYFRLGIASPQSARLVGEGVGAVRYCVFTTGEFVEPITVWDEPRRLAFDVAEQPEPMFELTPYQEIHPPHLHGSLESTRGEFRLEPQPDGGTRLVGRTWYRLRLAPTDYWSIWTNAILHRVHRRVLDHIATVAEKGSSPR